MLPEIGSNLWYDIDKVGDVKNITPLIYGYKGNDSVWLSSGRSSIKYVLQNIEQNNPSINKIALLPPYTCHTVFNPFYEENYQVETYDIDKHFKVTKKDIIDKVEKYKPSVVLLQRYFGFETYENPLEIVNELKKRNIIVIEDCTQALFSNLEVLPADYYCGSIRKFFGTPDGGFAASCCGVEFKKELAKPHDEYIDTMVQAAKLKTDYIENRIGNKEDFLKLFRLAEDELDSDTEFREISKVALRIQSNLDFEKIAKQRRENYKTLFNELSKCEGIEIVLGEVNDNEAPLYMPIYVKGDRVALQAHLRNSSIYAPIVWPKPERIPEVGEVAEDFYNHIICLPIDQRYDEYDMKRMAYRVKEFLKEKNLDIDIYYIENWLKQYYEKDGFDYGCFRYEHKDGTLVYPYVTRKAPKINDEEYYDIITPYGFNGPCVIDQNNDDLTNLIKDGEKAFDDYCKEKHIIAEYVRFCPWTKNVELFKDYYTLRYNNETVAIDLTVDDILMDEISSKRRNQIRLAQKKGVKVEFDFEGKTVDNFYELYQNTIKKNEIGNYYLFSKEFLHRHFELLKGNCWIANAKVGDRIISSSFVLMGGDNMHYHLSANDYTMNEYNGNSILLYEIAKLGKAYGCKYLHLGGIGVGEKSLMNFKTSFTKKGIYPFYVGTRVRNEEVYNKIVEKYPNDNPNYFPGYKRG